MKRTKIMLTAIVVLTVVGSALAFKARPIGDGSVYCEKQGNVCLDQRNFKIDPNGTVNDVCEGQEYVLTSGANPTCVHATGPFAPTNPGK